MSSPLHAATVGAWLQMLPQVARLVDKAEAHCHQHGLPPDALLDARLAPDMWTFAKQVMYSVHSSAGAIRNLREGLGGPDLSNPPTQFAALREVVEEAIALVGEVTPEELEAARERDVCFAFSTNRMEYTGEDFLLSFSMPNFFFHSAMAYAILRNQGLEVGKRDFLGRIRRKP